MDALYKGLANFQGSAFPPGLPGEFPGSNWWLVSADRKSRKSCLQEESDIFHRLVSLVEKV